MEDLMILITDDDTDDREFITDAFFQKGYGNNFKEFPDGAKLINYLNSAGREKNCLVLLDLNMPVMDGWTALKEIKTNDLLKKIPVIILTTSPSNADKNRCIELGCNDYMLKPLSVKEYEQIVDKCIKIFGESRSDFEKTK